MKWNCCTAYRGKHGYFVAFVVLDLPFVPVYETCLKLGTMDVHVGTTPLFNVDKGQWEVSLSDVSDADVSEAQSIEEVDEVFKAAGFESTGDVRGVEI